MRMLLTVIASLALVLAPASSALAQHEGMDMDKKEEAAKEDPAKQDPAKQEQKSGQHEEHAGQQGDDESVKGELVDLHCYITKGAKGEQHAECAQKCAAGGAPMGVLAADGTVYVLVPGHGQEAAYGEAKKHCGHMVEVTGHHAERGTIHVLAVSAIKLAG